MIEKEALIEKGFTRVQGSSVWHDPKSDIYVMYKDTKIDGTVKKIDAKTSTLSQLEQMIKSTIGDVIDTAEEVIYIVEDVIEDTAEVVIDIVEDVIEDTAEVVIDIVESLG